MLDLKAEKVNGTTHLVVSGEIDEECNIGETFKQLDGRVVVNLRNVSYVDSSGLREWIKAISNVPARCQLELHEVSVRFVYQLNMSLNARGRGRVVSFMAPYYCGRCEKRRDVLLVPEAHAKDLGRADAIAVPTQKCPDCGQVLIFDELPEEFFLFLKMQLKEGGA